MELQNGISVVIPNWNGKTLLEKYLPALIDVMQNSGLPCEIIISDDCSSDDSVSYVRQKWPDIQVISRAVNGGFSAAANTGAAQARYAKILFLNNDIKVVPGFIEPLLPFFKDDKTFAVSNLLMFFVNACAKPMTCSTKVSFGDFPWNFRVAETENAATPLLTTQMSRLIMNPTPLLFISNTASFFGGGQVSLIELLRLLDRNIFTAHVVVGAAGEMQQRFESLGISTQIVPMPPIKSLSCGAMVSAVNRLAAIVKSTGIKLIHANDSRSHLYGGIAARISGVPAVFHYRVSDSDGLIDKIVPLLCSRIITVSKATAHARFPSFTKKTEVVYNGVDITAFVPRSKPAGNLPLPIHHFPLIGTVGRVGSQKGMDILIKTIAILKKDFPDIGVIIAGKDEEGEEGDIKKLCLQQGLEKHFVFLDQWDDMPAFMAAIDAYVLLSNNEGLNRSLLEAMACGKAVVATNVGGNPEIINDQVGKLVPYGNPEAAAEAVRTLLSDKSLREKCGSRGRLTIEKHFSITRHVQQMSDLFEGLVA